MVRRIQQFFIILRLSLKIKGEIEMKKSILLLLVLVLTACSSAATEAPIAAPTEVPPTATPVVVVQTVVVEATQAPTEVPPTVVPPTVAPVVVTVVVEPTQAPAIQAPVEQPANGLITLDNSLGAGWFVDMTSTNSQLSLRCQLYKTITFSVKPTDANITEVQFWYRIEDRSTGAVFAWQNAGRMVAEVNGTFTLVFNGENVNADSRRPNAWLDYQFIGVSRAGDVIGRSEKIEKQIIYTFECP